MDFALLAIDVTKPVLTREIFGNIPVVYKGLFYGIAILTLVYMSAQARRKMRRWQYGVAPAAPHSSRLHTRRLLVELLQHSRIRGRGVASWAHALLFYGFFILFVGTCLIAAEHVLAAAWGLPHHIPLFHYGLYFAVYEVILEWAGLAFLAGVALFAVRRWFGHASHDHRTSDTWVLCLFLTLGLTGYWLEGLRILREQTPHATLSFVGWSVSQLWLLTGQTSATQLANWHFAVWWFHGLLAFGFLASIPHLRLWHAIAGAVQIATSDHRLGQLTPVSLEELEARGTIGAALLTDLSRQQLTSLDACVACGRCEDVCPAHAAGKPLSPKRVVQNLASLLPQLDLLETPDAPLSLALHGELVSAETLWSCTTCGACTDVCPLHVHPVELITDMRRHLVAEGELRGAPAVALQKSQRSGNPWGLPAQERFQWAHGLPCPTVADNPNFEILYWVGCAAAYDRRSQKIARAMVQLLNYAQVNYAVLANQERCTGECQRRMGDEFLFQELAQHNLDLLQVHRVRRIVTHCPHCLNSLRQDYGPMGGDWEVQHHSAYLAELVAAQRLPVGSTLSPSPHPNRSDEPQAPPTRVTFHDPCYLARMHGETEAPRELLQVHLLNRSATFVEMPRHGTSTACCGAGGGRMWMDDSPDQRIGSSRMDEIVSTSADIVAVGCPFCLAMVSDGLAHRNSPARVVDISELILESLNGTQDP